MDAIAIPEHNCGPTCLLDRPSLDGDPGNPRHDQREPTPPFGRQESRPQGVRRVAEGPAVSVPAARAVRLQPVEQLHWIAGQASNELVGQSLPGAAVRTRSAPGGQRLEIAEPGSPGSFRPPVHDLEPLGFGLVLIADEPSAPAGDLAGQHPLPPSVGRDPEVHEILTQVSESSAPGPEIRQPPCVRPHITVAAIVDGIIYPFEMLDHGFPLVAHQPWPAPMRAHACYRAVPHRPPDPAGMQTTDLRPSDVRPAPWPPSPRDART